MSKRIVSFPHMGNYYVAEKAVAGLFGDEILVPPRITKRTLEIGAKHSPESACIPFKYTLGNYVEALEQGANVLIQAGGGCRMGFYGEVQKAILRKLGYEFEFVKLINDHNVLKIGQYIKKIRPQHSYLLITKMLYLGIAKLNVIDCIEEIVRKNIGFEAKPGSFERLHKRFLASLDRAATRADIWKVKDKFVTLFAQLETHKPATPLRVGLVGEIYVVMEPFSNFFIEKELAQYGIEVHRFLTFTNVLQHGTDWRKHIRHVIGEALPYIHNEIGAHATDSVGIAHRLARQNFSGLIHAKPFGCMPEINAMPALHRISQDYRFPILYFSFDTLTSETGIKTRLEAFYDMLSAKGVENAN